MAESYNRYEHYTSDGKTRVLPYIEIPTASSDLIILYDREKMRMDMLSYKYYGSADYGWLIMQANPKYPSLEFLIPDMSRIRIPYPLTDALTRYETAIQNYEDANGVES